MILTLNPTGLYGRDSIGQVMICVHVFIVNHLQASNRSRYCRLLYNVVQCEKQRGP